MSARSIAVVKSMRPPFLILTPVCLLLGIAAALAYHGEVALDLAILVFIGGVAAHISANTFNEFFDFTNGLDTLTHKTPFSGGSGALPDDPSAQKLVLAAAVISLLITIVIGIYLVSVAGYLLFILGLLGVASIVAYSRIINRLPWLCLIAPGMAFGPLFVVGTYLSVTKPELVTTTSLGNTFLLSMVPFFLVNNLLLLNQFPDVAADRQVGRKTFPIVFGLMASIRVYLFFVLLTGIAMLLAVITNAAPAFALLALIPLALGINVYKGVLTEKFDTAGMIPYMGKNVVTTLVTTLVYGLAILLVTAMAAH